MGTNKRYADSIDRSAQERAAQDPEQQAQPRDWQPPWPPIRIAEAEWVVMRDAKNEPAAVIRAVRIGPRNDLFYRVVSWAPTSDGRTLVGYYTTLQLADRAVLFRPMNRSPRATN